MSDVNDPGAEPSGAGESERSNLTDPMQLGLAAASLRRLAAFFTSLAWIVIVLGFVMAVALASQASDSYDRDGQVLAALFTGGSIVIAGLWMLLLARAAEVFARYTAVRARTFLDQGI